MTDAGPPGASSNGFNENLTLFQNGQCGMWIDATVAASFVTNPDDSKVADQVGFALGTGQRSGQAQQLAVGLVTGHSCRHRENRFRAEIRGMGNQQGNIWNW